MTTNIYFSPTYNDTTVARETFRKALEIAASLTSNPIDGVVLVEPRSVTQAELERIHDLEYVQAVLTGVPYDLAKSQGLGWDEGLARAVSSSSGGVRDAALQAMSCGGIAGSLSSGLHHARRAKGAGYCTVNGLVIAARAALDAGAKRVLILDLDAHCGGGTAELIEGIEGLEQVDVSVIRYDNYGSTPQSRLVFAHGDNYLDVIESELARIADPAGIDLILYNAGMDPHEDAGGAAGIDTDMLRRREEMVFAWAHGHGLPLAWVLAGGYLNRVDMDGLVDLHRLTIDAAAKYSAMRGLVES